MLALSPARRGRDGADLPLLRRVVPARERGGRRARAGLPHLRRGRLARPPARRARRRARTGDRCAGPSRASRAPRTSACRRPTLRRTLAAAGCDPDAYAAYERRLRATGNVDFGDLILLPLRLLAERAGGEASARRTGSAWCSSTSTRTRTSRSSSSCASCTAATATSAWSATTTSPSTGSAAPRSANILSFPDVFPGTEIVRLERNYRSTQAILDVAAAVVSRNTGRLGKTLWTDAAAGEPVTLARLADQDDEAAWCARLVTPGRRDGDGDPLPDERAVPPVRGAVLPARHPVPRGGHRPVLRARGGEGRDRLARAPRQRARRDRVPPGGEPARARGRDARAWSGSSRTGGRAAAPCGTPAGGSGPGSPRRRGPASRTSSPRATSWPASSNPCPWARCSRRPSSAPASTPTTRSGTSADGTSKAGNLEELVNATAGYPPGAEGLTRFLEHCALNAAPEEADDARMAPGRRRGG